MVAGDPIAQELCDQHADGAWVRTRRPDNGETMAKSTLTYRPFDNVATIRPVCVYHEVSGEPIPVPRSTT